MIFMEQVCILRRCWANSAGAQAWTHPFPGRRGHLGPPIYSAHNGVRVELDRHAERNIALLWGSCARGQAPYAERRRVRMPMVCFVNAIMSVPTPSAVARTIVARAHVRGRGGSDVGRSSRTGATEARGVDPSSAAARARNN